MSCRSELAISIGLDGARPSGVLPIMDELRTQHRSSEKTSGSQPIRQLGSRLDGQQIGCESVRARFFAERVEVELNGPRLPFLRSRLRTLTSPECSTSSEKGQQRVVGNGCESALPQGPAEPRQQALDCMQPGSFIALGCPLAF